MLPASPVPRVPVALNWAKGELKASGLTQPELQAKSKPITRSQTSQSKKPRSRLRGTTLRTRPGRRGPCMAGPVSAGLERPTSSRGRSRAPVSALSGRWLGRPLTPPPSLTGGMRGLLLHAALRHRSHGVWRKTHKVLFKNRLPLRKWHPEPVHHINSLLILTMFKEETCES